MMEIQSVNMHIAHVVESFSPLSETFIYNYVVGIKNRGYGSSVYTRTHVQTEGRHYDPVYVWPLVPQWAPQRALSGLAVRLKMRKVHDHIFSLARRSALRLFQKHQPNIIHAQFGPEGVMIAPVAQKLDIPLVVSFLGYDISILTRDPYWIKQYQSLSEQVDAAIGVSNYVCERLISIGFPSDKVKRVHLGADTSSVAFNDSSQSFDGHTVRCLHVGRLVPKKSPVCLIQAFANARRMLSPDFDLRLTIAGEGPLQSAIEQIIRDEDVADSVRLLGAVTQQDALQLMQSAHIYTQYCETAPDGDQEGQPVSLVEASASGLPVVTTRHSGIPDVIIDAVNGYLVEEGDIQGMTERIVELARNPKQRAEFGRAGRQHIEAGFTLEQQLDETLDLYKAILK